MGKRTVAMVVYLEIEDTDESLEDFTRQLIGVADYGGLGQVLDEWAAAEFYVAEVGDTIITLSEWAAEFNP